MMPGLVKQLQIIVADMGLPGIRATGYNLDVNFLFCLRSGPQVFLNPIQPLPGFLCLIAKVSQFLKQILSGRIVPVQSETDLQSDGRLPGNF